MINMSVPVRRRQLHGVPELQTSESLVSTVTSISIRWDEEVAILDVDPILGLSSGQILEEFGATTLQKQITLVLGLRHVETAKVIIFDFVQGSTDKCMLQVDLETDGSGSKTSKSDDVVFGVAAESELPLARMQELEDGEMYELITADIRRVQFVPRLTKEEMNQLRREFDAIDADDDGQITMSELDACLEDKKREALRHLHETHMRQRAMSKNPDRNAQKAIDGLFQRMLESVIADKKKTIEEAQTASPASPAPLQVLAQMTPSDRAEEFASKKIDFSEFLCVRAKDVIQSRPENATKTAARRARGMTVRW